MPGWDDFFMCQVGASAGLAGLLLGYVVSLANAWVLAVEFNR